MANFIYNSSPGGLINGSARDTQAALYRQQFDDYVSRFGAAENELVSAYGNKGLRDNRIAESVDYANQGVDNAQKAQQINLSRYQAAMTPQEKEAQRRAFALERGLATTDVANKTRQHIMDRDSAMLTGGLSTYGKGNL